MMILLLSYLKKADKSKKFVSFLKAVFLFVPEVAGDITVIQ